MLRTLFSTPTYVRERSPWILTSKAYGFAFALVVLAVFGSRFANRHTTSDEKPAVAVVDVHEPGLVDQSTWQKVRAQGEANLLPAIDEQVTSLGDGGTRVFLSLRSRGASDQAAIINAFAQSLADTCRLQSKTLAHRQAEAAQEVVELAQQQVSHYERLLQRCQTEHRTTAAAANPPPQAPAIVDNPQWQAYAQNVDILEAQLRQLLSGRTENHPSVRQLKDRIDEARHQLSRIPRQFVTYTPEPAQSVVTIASAPAPDPTDLAKRQSEVDQAKRKRDAAQAQLRAALAACNRELRIEIEPAVAPVITPATFQGLIWQTVSFPTLSILFSPLTAGIAAILALIAFSAAAALEPVVTHVDELRDIVPAPIIGIVPAKTTRDFTAAHRRARRLLRASLAVAATVLFAIAVGAGWAG